MWITKLNVTIIIIVLFIFTIAVTFTDLLEIIGMNVVENRTLWLIFSIVLIFLFGLQRQMIIWELQWRLDEKRDLQQRIDRIAKFRSEAINNLYARTPKKEEFSQWKKSYFSWQKSVEKYFKDNFPYAMVEIFEDLGIVPARNFFHVSKDPEIAWEHLHFLQMLAKQLMTIESIIDKHTTVTFEREPSFIEVLRYVRRDG